VASLNSVTLIGRLTKDPEMRTFGSGGKVASFSMALNKKRKNKQTGQLEDSVLFLDISAFNGQNSKTADIIESYCHKGSQVAITGELEEDRWQDKSTGQQRSKIKILAHGVVLLDSKNTATVDPRDSEKKPMAGEGRPDDDDSIPF
jgi:single-strand DNA-binding protein